MGRAALRPYAGAQFGRLARASGDPVGHEGRGRDRAYRHHHLARAPARAARTDHARVPARFRAAHLQHPRPGARGPAPAARARPRRRGDGQPAVPPAGADPPVRGCGAAGLGGRDRRLELGPVHVEVHPLPPGRHCRDPSDHPDRPCPRKHRRGSGPAAERGDAPAHGGPYPRVLMQEWWGYRPGDFLLFSPRISPRTYWRLFQLANEALWPLQIPVLLIGTVILTMLFRPRAWADRAIPAVLAAAWLSVSVGFLWMHYAAINWAAVYFVPVFVGEAVLVFWLGTVRGRLTFAAERGVAGMIGIALYVYALALHPLIALVAGRPLQAAEVVGIAPDPTAIATLGLLSLAPRRTGTLPLIILPIIWCLASALTLRTMGASEGWIPLTAAALAVLAQAWPRRSGTCSTSDAAPDDQRRPVRGSADVGRSAHRL